MNYETILNDIRKYYSSKQVSFSKDDQKFNTGKDTPKGRMFGFLTKDYYKRGKLFQYGEVNYCYAFKSFVNNFSDLDKPYLTWVLFSPEKYFSKNPSLYLDIVQKLDNIANSHDKTNKRIHKLKNALTEVINEPRYIEIPEEYSNGHLIYLSSVYLRPNQVRNFRLGINLIIYNQSISKEVCYLPNIYWTDEYINFYLKGDN